MSRVVADHITVLYYFNYYSMVSNKVFVAFLGNGTQLDTDSLHPIFGASRIFLLGSGMDGEFLHPLWVSCKHGCCTASLYRLFLRSTQLQFACNPRSTRSSAIRNILLSRLQFQNVTLHLSASIEQLNENWIHNVMR